MPTVFEEGGTVSRRLEGFSIFELNDSKDKMKTLRIIIKARKRTLSEGY